MSLIDRLISFFLILLFAFTAVDKALHFSGFVKAINTYRLIPIPLGDVLAPIIIAAELTIAIGLLRDVWRRVAALQGAILMTIFTIGLLGNRLLGSNGICGCWFSIDMARGDAHFALNVIIIMLCLVTWRSPPILRSVRSPDRS